MKQYAYMLLFSTILTTLQVHPEQPNEETKKLIEKYFGTEKDKKNLSITETHNKKFTMDQELLAFKKKVVLEKIAMYRQCFDAVKNSVDLCDCVFGVNMPLQTTLADEAKMEIIKKELNRLQDDIDTDLNQKFGRHGSKPLDAWHLDTVLMHVKKKLSPDELATTKQELINGCDHLTQVISSENPYQLPHKNIAALKVYMRVAPDVDNRAFQEWLIKQISESRDEKIAHAIFGQRK